MSIVQAVPRRHTQRLPPANTRYRVCRRCIMDTSDPEITFDAMGHCCHCRAYEDRAQTECLSGAPAQEKLQSLVRRIQAAGHRKEYDCVIGVSGGVDSTMVAYHTRQLGLRPLAVHLDNGWNSELAVDNIRNTLDALQLDLLTHVIDWEEFRDLQLSFLEASVPNCEIPTDHAINATIVNTALRHDIRYILTGGNLSTEGIMPSSWGYCPHDLKHIRAIHRCFGSKRLKTFPQLSFTRFVYAVLFHRIRFIPILNLLDYNKEESKKLIEREFGWRDYGGKHHESLYTKFFQNYILPEKFGFDKRRAHLSTLICSGQITRDEALQEVAEPYYRDGELTRDREYVLKKLGLTEAAFDALIHKPKKRHLEYPSHNLIYQELRTMNRIFKRIATSG